MWENMCVRERICVRVCVNMCVRECDMFFCAWDVCVCVCEREMVKRMRMQRSFKNTHFRIYCFISFYVEKSPLPLSFLTTGKEFLSPPFSSPRILCLWVSWKIHQVSLVSMSLQLELVPTDRQTRQRFLVVRFCWSNCAPVSSNFKSLFPSLMKNGLSSFILETPHLIWPVVFLTVMVEAMGVMSL